MAERSAGEPTFLLVGIVQEQQAHYSSGRGEQSSLRMIAIIQAICANKSSVFIYCLVLRLSPRLSPQCPFFCFPPQMTIFCVSCGSSFHTFRVTQTNEQGDKNLYVTQHIPDSAESRDSAHKYTSCVLITR